jgi:hypothetical protein
MTPSRRRKKAARRSGEGLWPILACCALGACLLLVGVVAKVAVGSPWLGTAEPPPQQQHVYTDEEMRTGSILFVPLRGDECQHNLFDNKTGQIWHSGYVSCDVALSKTENEKSKGWSLARTEAIRGGFRWKN